MNYNDSTTNEMRAELHDLLKELTPKVDTLYDKAKKFVYDMNNNVEKYKGSVRVSEKQLEWLRNLAEDN